MKLRVPAVLVGALAVALLPFAAVAQPSINLVKTVGTTPGVCAATDSVTVTAGTTVYYCYQAQNTGTVAFSFHDLTDNLLGTVLNDFPFALAPGAFSPQVIVASTPTATVTNTGTWTAVSALVPYTVNTGASFSYIPINATGTALLLADDGEANITLPFSFSFFGASSTNLRVGNNGGILFGVTTGDLAITNTAIPAASPANAILPFWDDIDSDTGDVYWQVNGVAPNRVAIIEWFNRPHFSNVGSATFQVLLYETSNEIRFQYLDVDFGDALYNNGASATVGLNQGAGAALQVSFNQAVINAGQAILFTPITPVSASDTDTATVTVLIPNINVSPLTLSSTQAANTTTNQTLTIANTGAGQLDWNIAEVLPGPPPAGGAPNPMPPVSDEPIVQSVDDCKLYEVYAGREPEGWAEFCGEGVPEVVGGAPEAPTSNGYAVDVRNQRFVRFTLNNFPGQTNLGPQTGAIFALDFDPTGTVLYAIENTASNFGTLNLANGVFTPLIAATRPAGTTIWTGMTIHPVTGVIYVSASDASSNSFLYTFNPATGISTLVGPMGVQFMIDIAINRLGQMYGHSISTDSIYTINTSTGTATLVGPTGFNANFAQGMDFDNDDGTLYIFLYVGSGVNHYGTVNLATGAVTPLATTNPSGEFEGATQTLAVCIPTNYPWLSVSPASGSTTGGASSPVTVTFDSTGLALGTYTGALCVNSNDPDAGFANGTRRVPVAVQLNVACVLTPPANLIFGTTAPACNAVVNYTVGASAGCGTVTCVPPPGSTFPLGTTTVNCSSQFGGTTLSFGITVVDDDPPAMACPNVTDYATNTEGGTVVTYAPTALDNCSGATAVTCAPPSGTFLPIGVTPVTCTSPDGAGNVGTCNFNAEVIARPVIEIPTLSPLGLAGLGLLLGAGALVLLRRRRSA